MYYVLDMKNIGNVMTIYIYMYYVLDMKNIGNGMTIYIYVLCTRYEEYWEWDEYIFIY